MKKHLRKPLALALAALMGLATACDKDNSAKADVNQIPEFSMPSLEGTSWRGYYQDVLYHNGTHQMIFTWTVDFIDDSTGMVMMEVTSPVIEDIVEDFDLAYTYDGSGKGRLGYTGLMYEYRSDFEVDAINHSIDANLWMHFQVSEQDTAGTLFGGRTTLYQVTE